MNKNDMKYEGFVGVHVGAGNHSHEKTREYEELCKEASKKAVKALRNGSSALNALVEAMALLEDSPLTNAGLGSNLTEDGTVECDAGLMDGKHLLFGGVGAVSGIRNPIVAAKKLVDEQKLGLKDIGRVPPSFLVGPTIRTWAHRMGIETCEPRELISAASKNLFKTYKRKMEAGPVLSAAKLRKTEEKTAFMNKAEVSDTVGAVVCDQFGNVASATSSGGIALKQCGRVGQAALYGCGCWSQCARENNHVSIGISTSGCGEYLIRTHFAKECAHNLLKEGTAALQLKEFVERDFLKSPFLQNVSKKLAGVIVFRHDVKNNIGEFLWCHTTNSMCIGYMSTSDKLPKARMSRLPANGKPGKTIVIEGTMQSLDRCKTTVTTTV